MKLSEIVAAKNLLVNSNIRSISDSSLVGIQNIFELAEKLPPAHSQALTVNFNNVKESINAFAVSIENQIHEYTELINTHGHEYFQKSTTLYQEQMVQETNQYILGRRLSITEPTLELIKKRMAGLVNSFYTGAILRPCASSDLIKDMVAFNPLYLIDTSEELIHPAIENFTSQYQNRLCLYEIKESPSDPVLNTLPDNNFGMFLAYGYFDFKPMEIVKNFLKEIFLKLKPGGTLAFTINDCDFEHNVFAVEQNYMCYTPGHLILEYARQLGFTKMFELHDNGIHWFELKKPGELTTLRGGQAFALIARQPT
jgi:SAM-dependent methyltransferase